VAHRLAAALDSDEVEGAVDWTRRFDHMQQHSGQHLLSAVLEELFHFKTVSFHLGSEASTIDVEAPALDAEKLRAAERRANELVFANRPLHVEFENASGAQGLRKASEREGELRIVTIENFDRSACGGTHVRSTGEIGPILLRKTEKIRSTMRIEFLCGRRAVNRARADFEALSSAARVFSAALDEVPALVAAQVEAVKEAEKARRKLLLERAEWSGRTLYDAASPDAKGRRRHTERRAGGAPDDELRALAQSFTARPGGVYLAAFTSPAAVFLAVSSDLGLHAGNLLKPLLSTHGGRGGGNAQLAQGSLPTGEALDRLLADLGLLLE
jgi:alanyl-tRNA synthetase